MPSSASLPTPERTPIPAAVAASDGPRAGRTMHEATVVDRQRLSARFVRLTLAGPSLRGLEVRPAQDIELLLDDDGHRVKRRYTVRHARAAAGEIDVDVVLHRHAGPGSRWGEHAETGSTIRFLGPRGTLELRAADWHLFVGDESALPAIAALVDALGGETRTLVVAEVETDEDRLPVAATSATWICRNGAPGGSPDLLADALRGLDVPPGGGRAYLLGESRAMRALQLALPPLGIPAEHAYVKGYWNAAGRGRERTRR